MKNQGKHLKEPAPKRLKPNLTSFSDLPVHIIEKILKFAFEDFDIENLQLASVCQLFYNTFCKLYRDKRTLKLELEDMILDKNGKLKNLLEHRNTFRVRTFSKLKLNFSDKDDQKIAYSHSHELFKEFLRQYGVSMTELQVHGIKCVKVVQEVLSLTNNIKHLGLTGSVKHIDLRNLTSLTSLDMSLNHPQFLSSIKVRENSLEKVELTEIQEIEMLKKFLSTQSKSLKHFEYTISDECPAVDILENCRLESLCIDGFSSSSFDSEAIDPCLIEMLESQTELKSLHIGMKIGEEFIDALAKCQKLQKLKLYEWESLSTTVELPVTDLKIEDLELDSSESILCFKKTFPKLKKLAAELSTGIDICDLIKDFPDLECFDIESVKNLTGNGSFPTPHEKLQSLTILATDFQTDLKFLDSLPNLVELITFWEPNKGVDVAKVIRQITERPKLKKIELLFPKTVSCSLDFTFNHQEHIYISNWINESPKDTIKQLRCQGKNRSFFYEVFRPVKLGKPENSYSLVIAKHKAMLRKFIYYTDITVSRGTIHS